jgi:phosphatidylglycerophosphatase A
MKQIGLAVATFLGTGFLPVAPGTWASAFVALIVYFTPLSGAPFIVMAGMTAVIFAIGIPAAGVSETHFGKKDPRPCVIDEVAGQLVSLWFLPPQAGYYVAAFFLFRIFDIIKPFPVRKSESLPGGLGIMVDDVLAGAYVLALLLLARRFLAG